MSPPNPPTAPTPQALPTAPDQAVLLERIDARLEHIDARLEHIDARLEHMEARLARLDPLLAAAPGLIAVVADSFDDFARELGDLDGRLRGLLLLAERVSRPETLAQLHLALDLLGSDLLAPGAIESLGRAARALATATGGPATKLGLFGALGALREPEVQRALGFAIAVARGFGAAAEPLPALPTQTITQAAKTP